MAVTIYDIAEKANVSVATASRVLNGNNKGMRSDAKLRAEKILALANKLGYQPDDTARSIRTGKAKIVAFANSAPLDIYSSIMMNPMTATLDSLGYVLFPVDVDGINHDASKYEKLLDSCIKNRVSALIVRGMKDQKLLRELKAKLDKLGVHFAMLSNTAEISGCIHVNSCDFTAARRAVDYLYDLGHRRLLFANNDANMETHTVIRMQGFEERAKELHLDYEIITKSKPGLQSLLAKILAKGNKLRPTAIVCRGDSVGALIQTYLLYEHGIRCPDDYSIISFGGEASKSAYPRMTVIREPHEDMSILIAKKIVAKIEDRDYGNKSELLEDELIVGATTAAPPATE